MPPEENELQNATSLFETSFHIRALIFPLYLLLHTITEGSGGKAIVINTTGGERIPELALGSRVIDESKRSHDPNGVKDALDANYLHPCSLDNMKQKTGGRA